MPKKIKKQGALPQKDLEAVKENLEKTGEALGDLFKSIFSGVGKILDIAAEMESKGEKTRAYRKEIRGTTRNGKEYQGEAGWRVKTGILEDLSKKRE